MSLRHCLTAKSLAEIIAEREDGADYPVSTDYLKHVLSTIVEQAEKIEAMDKMLSQCMNHMGIEGIRAVFPQSEDTDDEG